MPAPSRRSFLQLVGFNGLAAAASACGTHLAPEARPARTVAPPLGAPGTTSSLIRLSSNENSSGPGEKVLAAMQDAFGAVNRYPFRSARHLQEALAASLRIDTSQLVLGCGSSEILDAAARAFTSAERGLVTPVPTFELLADLMHRLRRPVADVPVTGSLELDLQQMADRSAGAGLVYVCNPNNPTGTLHGAKAIEEFVAAVHRTMPGATVLIDEAYHEFVERPDHHTAIPVALASPRVIVSRTFSKIYGLAGMRIGYAVGQPETMQAMGGYLDDLQLSHLSSTAALIALADPGRVAEQRAQNSAARAFTVDVFRQAGYAPIASDANFVMVDVRRDIRLFQSACLHRGIEIARPFPPLLTYARITIGTKSEMERAAVVFRAALAEPAATTALLPPIAGRRSRRDAAWVC